jgi:hypothetical protein
MIEMRSMPMRNVVLFPPVVSCLIVVAITLQGCIKQRCAPRADGGTQSLLESSKRAAVEAAAIEALREAGLDTDRYRLLCVQVTSEGHVVLFGYRGPTDEPGNAFFGGDTGVLVPREGPPRLFLRAGRTHDASD